VAANRIVELTQLVEGFEMEPSKAKLQEISRELQRERSKAQKMAELLLGSEDPFMVEKTFEMMGEIEEALQ
jgi:hypothetical protein